MLNAAATPVEQNLTPVRVDTPAPHHDLGLRRVAPALAGALLVLWCTLGLSQTVERLASREVGWRLARPAEARGTVGLPLPGGAEVTAIRQLLASVDPSAHAPWLVVYPPESDRLALEYVRVQLLHLEYPRRVDVITTAMPTPAVPYVGIITHPRVSLTGGPGRLAANAGFHAFGSPGR